MSVESITARGRSRTAEMFEQRDQWAIVYELQETVGAGGQLSEAWVEVTAGYVAFSQGESVRLARYGASEMPAGSREMQFVAPMPLLDEGQGVHVTTGPEGGTAWRILFVDRSERVLVFALVQPLDEDFA